MAVLVQNTDIENTAPQLQSVSATASVVSPTRLGRAKRSFFSIIPLTASIEVTIVFGDSTPSAGKGIVLTQNQVFAQSLDVNGKGVYQGQIQAIASGNGQIAFIEVFEA